VLTVGVLPGPLPLKALTGRPATWVLVLGAFGDHEHGAWFRILRSDNRNTTREKSNAGKVEYHNIGACYDVLGVLALSS